MRNRNKIESLSTESVISRAKPIAAYRRSQPLANSQSARPPRMALNILFQDQYTIKKGCLHDVINTMYLPKQQE